MMIVMVVETLPTMDFTRYLSVINSDLYTEVQSLAKPLQGKKVVIVNSTANGGGVAEILRGYVPVLRSLGIDARWLVMAGDEPFFGVTKQLHNTLQGGGYALTDSDKDLYLKTNQSLGKFLKTIAADIWEIHDAQPLAAIAAAGLKNAIWRCHVDTSQPNPGTWQFLKPFIDSYQQLIFTLPGFMPSDVDAHKCHFVVPAINPFTPKNLPINSLEASQIMRQLGINPSRPTVTQISRFDRWKDPLGVIQAYRMAKPDSPRIQLVLAGSAATDDPEATAVLAQVKQAAAGDPDIHILADLTEQQVNALQTASFVIVQKSLKEGFGLTVAEGLWHNRPVIGGSTGGIKLQIQNGVTGFLVDSVEACADRIVSLVRYPGIASQKGKAGHAYVREHFLLPRLVRDHLSLYHKMLKV